MALKNSSNLLKDEYDVITGQTGGIIVKNKQITALLYGWIVVFGLMLFTSIILAFFLQITTLDDPLLSRITFGLGLISLFIGGFIAGMKGKSKGWLNGGMIGVGFTLFVYLVQYLGYKQAFSLEQSFYHLGYILSALIGGVIGVNFVSSKQ